MQRPCDLHYPSGQGRTSRGRRSREGAVGEICSLGPGEEHDVGGHNSGMYRCSVVLGDGGSSTATPTSRCAQSPTTSGGSMIPLPLRS